MKTCPNCKAEMSDEFKLCGKCGSTLEPQKRLCPKCGIELTENMKKFCGKCGADVTVNANTAPVQAPPQQQQAYHPHGQPQYSPPRQENNVPKKKTSPIIIALIVIGSAVALFVIAGVILALTDNSSDTSPPVVSSPAREQETSATEQYRRTLTLGGFKVANYDAPDTQRGWASDNSINLNSSGAISDFTGAKYLIVEFSTAPTGGIDLVWKCDDEGYYWEQTDGIVSADGTEETTLVIDLTTINGYQNFRNCNSAVVVYLCYYSDTWDDLPIKDAYFAE